MAVATRLLEGLSVADAVRRAAWIGTCAVQVLADTEGLPRREQLVAIALSLGMRKRFRPGNRLG
jgi:sugar/nucleoside kinase (ribokinase family)